MNYRGDFNKSKKKGKKSLDISIKAKIGAS
jgi:hypothetical protein